MKEVLGERRKALRGSLRLAPTSKSGPASFFTASKNDDTLSMPACGSRTRMVGLAVDLDADRGRRVLIAIGGGYDLRGRILIAMGGGPA